MKFDYLKLANIIKNRREELNISTRKLSEKIGISHAEISRFENGLKPSFYFIPFIKMCTELQFDVVELLQEVGLLDEIQERKFVVKITNVDEDYFEIMAKDEREAAIIVTKFVLQNDIIELDPSERIDVEVEEIQEKNEDDFKENYDEDEEEFDSEECCETCQYYCPYCGECTFGE